MEASGTTMMMKKRIRGRRLDGDDIDGDESMMLSRQEQPEQEVGTQAGRRRRRRLDHNDGGDIGAAASSSTLKRLPTSKETEELIYQGKLAKDKKKHDKLMDELYAHPQSSYLLPTDDRTTHGIVIDAGSSHTRIYIYEWEPRIVNQHDHEMVGSILDGSFITMPKTHTEWTDRVHPGLDQFVKPSIPSNRFDNDNDNADNGNDGDDVNRLLRLAKEVSKSRDMVETVDAISSYLSPLFQYARTLLHHKQNQFKEFPIYLYATAGLRMLPEDQRNHLLDAIRLTFLTNRDLCPFRIDDPMRQVRVISGEEEGAYDWLGVNYLLNPHEIVGRHHGLPAIRGDNDDIFGPSDVIENAHDDDEYQASVADYRTVGDKPTTATAAAPPRFHGSLDMGGASAQIAFYQPEKAFSATGTTGSDQRNEEAVLSNLYTINVGPTKSYSLYVHSYLYYGITEAQQRYFGSLVASPSTISSPAMSAANDDKDENVSSVVPTYYDPCLPGGTFKEITFNKRYTIDTDLMWRSAHNNNNDGTQTDDNDDDDEYITAIVSNPNVEGNDDSAIDQCMDYALRLLHLEENTFCNFAFHGKCSFAGVYQPQLPIFDKDGTEEDEFIAFSNFEAVWDFLQLPEHVTMDELEVAVRDACSMNWDDLVDFNDGAKDYVDELDSYCFRSAYAYQLLHRGFGFGKNGSDKKRYQLRAIKKVDGYKVGWSIGAMLYEVNQYPWKYVSSNGTTSTITSLDHYDDSPSDVEGIGDDFVLVGVDDDGITTTTTGRPASSTINESSSSQQDHDGSFDSMMMLFFLACLAILATAWFLSNRRRRDSSRRRRRCLWENDIVLSEYKYDTTRDVDAIMLIHKHNTIGYGTIAAVDDGDSPQRQQHDQ